MACPDCVSGTLHTGTPSGRVETLHNLPTYITEPPSSSSSNNAAPPQATIIMIPDVFGWEAPNNRLLCDTYAKRANAIVYLPEFQGGNALPMDVLGNMKTVTEGEGWMVGKIPSAARVIYYFAPFLFRNRVAVTTPRIQAFFAAVRETSSLPLFAAGFCWGGLHAVYLTHPSALTPSGKPLVDAAFTAHPSALTVPADVEKAEKPLSISNGTRDFMLKLPGIESVKTVFKRKNEEEKEAGDGDGDGEEKFEIRVVEGARHGFAVRGNPDDEEEMKQAQVAEDQAVDWFRRWSEKLRAK
ncbi:MAG: hypothetical protein Q9219_000756 [cf. Caloplaca sp. 3 TL-2023]